MQLFSTTAMNKTMRKTKKSTTLAITDIGKMIRINATVKPVYKYESSSEDIFILTNMKSFRVLETIPKKETYCYVLKHKMIRLGEYKKGNYESRGMFGEEDCSQAYLEVTDTVKVYLCTESIACNKPTFLVHPNNIVEIVNDN